MRTCTHGGQPMGRGQGGIFELNFEIGIFSGGFIMAEVGQKKQRNYVLDLLKVLFCFLVVIYHFISITGLAGGSGSVAQFSTVGKCLCTCTLYLYLWLLVYE